MMIVMPLRDAGPEPTAQEKKEGSSQTENAPAAPPSAPEANHPTAERTSPVSTIPITQRGNLRANQGSNGQAEGEASRAALERIDRIKANLRELIGNLNDAVSTLKTAEKEQRASLKEMQNVRAKLREIRSVEL
jgi:hypothetical protein